MDAPLHLSEALDGRVGCVEGRMMYDLVARTTARVTGCLLARETALFGRLREGHVAAENAQHTAAVDGAFEAAQCAVDGLVIPYFDTYGHDRSLLEWMIIFETALKYTDFGPLTAKPLTPPNPPKLLISTRNPHKLREIMAILDGAGVELVSLERFPDAPDVIEDRNTLEGNAAKKAEELYRLTGLPTMSDDTGLEVDALGGAPGVRSARYAGEDADAAANRALLLDQLDGADNRRARFRTVIALATDTGTRFFEGVCEGDILREERGHGGFGYDPLFQPDGHAESFAEMAADTKNAISHRGRALAAFAAAMHAGEVRP